MEQFLTKVDEPEFQLGAKALKEALYRDINKDIIQKQSQVSKYIRTFENIRLHPYLDSTHRLCDLIQFVTSFTFEKKLGEEFKYITPELYKDKLSDTSSIEEHIKDWDLSLIDPILDEIKLEQELSEITSTLKPNLDLDQQIKEIFEGESTSFEEIDLSYIEDSAHELTVPSYTDDVIPLVKKERKRRKRSTRK